MTLLYLIQVPYWGHATLLEVLWLISGTIAATFTIANLRDSWKDRRALRIIKGDPEIQPDHYRMIEVAANGRVESQASRLVIALLIVATGIVGVFQANPLRGGTTWTGLTVTGALVLIGMITAARSALDYRQRATLYDMAVRRANGRGETP